MLMLITILLLGAGPFLQKLSNIQQVYKVREKSFLKTPFFEHSFISYTSSSLAYRCW
jgi:hypothetical protein